MTIYYVDSASGTDSANGTSTVTPWQTITKVNATTFVPGDQILFKCGSTWANAALVCDNNGTSGNRIVYGSYSTGAKPILNGGALNYPISVTANYVTISGLQATNGGNADKVGIQIYGTDCLVTGVTATGNSIGVQAASGAHRARITASTLSNNTTVIVGPASNDDYGANGVVILQADNCEIDHNTINGNTGASPDFGQDGSAVEIFGSIGTVVHHNMAVDNQTFTELGDPRTSGTIFHNNIILSGNSGSIGFNIQGTGPFGPVTGTKIYNNTVYLYGGSTQGFICDTGADVGTSLHNNIIWADYIGYTGGLKIDEGHNVFNGGGFGNEIYSTANSGAGIAPTSTTANPQFTSSSDRHLQATSPAINRGVSNYGYTTDYDGNVRPSTSVDAGAYEYGAAAPAGTVTPDSLIGTGTLTAPTVSGGALGSGGYGAGTYGTGAYSPTGVAPAGITGTSTLGAPAVSGGSGTFPDSITATPTLGAPVVTGGAFTGYGAGNYGSGVYGDTTGADNPGLTDPETLVPPTVTGGAAPTVPTTGTGAYGQGGYGTGSYAGGTTAPEPAPSLGGGAGAAFTATDPLHLLGIGPWSPVKQWRGARNYGIGNGVLPARPAMPLPGTQAKGFTLRLNDGGEARADLTMARSGALIVEEISTDLWWRRRDPHTGRLEIIGRFNCSHNELARADDGTVSSSLQFVDYRTLLGERMVLKYKDSGYEKNPDGSFILVGGQKVFFQSSIWPKDTPVTEIMRFAVPTNMGLDLSQIAIGGYDLGTITHPYTLDPASTIADMFTGLLAISPKPWEWWIETPDDVSAAPKLRFIVGKRGANRGVTLFDYGIGATPIASWQMRSTSDTYANSLYFSGGTGGIITQIPAQIDQFGQRDTTAGNAALGGDINLITQAARKKLTALADRSPTFTVTLRPGFWKGRAHIDVGDTVHLRIRLGDEFLSYDYRVTEITVDVDVNGAETVQLTLGKPHASGNPRSRNSPLIKVIRTLKNYVPPTGSDDVVIDPIDT